MMGSYQRHMVNQAMTRKYYTEEAEGTAALVRCPRQGCGRECQETLKSVNGAFAYFKCTRPGCPGTARREVSNG